MPLRAGLAVALTLLLACGPADAASDASADQWGELSGVLKHVRQAGVVKLGYRESSVPFSYAAAGSQPYGYSIDLCRSIVQELVDATGGRPLGIEFRRVTPENRIQELVAGNIDLECGSTTITPERRKQAAFSPQIFITGTKLAVRKGSGIRSFRDLDGRRVAVARGTTNEEAIRHLIARAGLGTTVVTTTDIAEAFDEVAGGRADAVASDNILLHGFLAEKRSRGNYDIVGQYLSYEAYGVMFARDDPALAAAVDRALRKLAKSGELRRIYNKWFVRPLPSGIRLDLPMSPELRRSFEMLGMPPE